MRPLRVGVQLPHVEYVASWSEHVEMAQLAEAIGVDALWLGDHLLYRSGGRPERGPWEAWSMLAALAAVTSRVYLGPLVACTSFHQPTMLAKMAATVDEVSGGRLVLGLGAGWNEAEYRAFGIPFDHRVSRFEEAFTIIRTLLREGAVDFHGRYYEAEDCALVPRGPRPAGPRLMVGSNGERMLRITLPHVDAWTSWFTAFHNDPARLPPLLARVDATCRSVGRDPSEVTRSVAVLVAFPDAVGRGRNDPTADPVRPLPASPAELAERLCAFAAVGIDEVQLVLDPITPASIEALGPMLEILDQASSAGPGIRTPGGLSSVQVTSAVSQRS